MEELLKQIISRLDKFEKGQNSIEQKLENFDERFNKIDERFNQVDERFSQIDERFNQVEERFSERFDLLEGKYDTLETKLNAIYEQTALLTEFRQEVNQKLDNVIEENEAVHMVLGKHEVTLVALKRRPV